MSDDRRSASPPALFGYADVMQSIDVALFKQAAHLASTLDHFSHACTEFPQRLNGSTARPMRLLSQQMFESDAWVRTVGQAFAAADRPDDRLGFGSKMNDLHREIDKLYDGDPEEPIKIVLIGPNEYLVLIAGTDTDGTPGSNDWPSNWRTGQNMPSEYLRRVREAMEQSGIPEGANVHLAGHSQGGNVAMMLADIQDFVDLYEIQSVTTFGSPPNVPINPRLGQEKYHNFAIITDPVPYSTSPVAMGIGGGLLSRISPLVSLSLFSADLAPRFKNTVIPETPSIGAAHGAYKDSPFLKTLDLPFQVKQWTVIDTYSAGDYDPLRRELDDAFGSGNGPGQRFIGASDAWIDLHKQAALSIVQTVTTRLTYNAPEPLRTAVDRGLDRMAALITTGARPSEALSRAAQGVVDASQKIAGGYLRATTGTGEGILHMLRGNFVGDLQAIDGMNQGSREARQGLTEGIDDLIHGRIDEGSRTIADGMAEGATTVIDGYREGMATKIDGAIKGAETIAEGAIDGAAQVAGGTLQGITSVGTGIKDFLF